MSARDQRHRAGFSALELIVASTLMILALLLAAALLSEAGAQMAWDRKKLADPVVELVFEQFRVDVRGSSAALGDELWNYGRLELIGHFTGADVTYELDDQSLLRRVGAPGEKAAARPVLGNVKLFRWRRSSVERALEIEVGFSRTADLTARRDPTLREAREPIEERRAIVVALRRQTSSWY
jgi:hypothetical protein